MSISILVARRSALADWLTICLTIALLDDRLALADLAALAVDGDVDLLVQCGDQECGQALAARAARVAGLALLEGPAPRWLAIAIS